MTRSQRTLLIGASGQLGRALAVQFSDSALIKASHRHARLGELCVDLGDAVATQSVLRESRPDLILVAGAMCNVDQCELDADACERVNTRGPALIADYARGHGARVVFFSTDHVFDGSKTSCCESDAVNPLNVYARSKVRAEESLRDLLPEAHVIVRTGWVYGPDRERRNFVLRLIDRISNGETVAVPSDQWGSPTYTGDIAQATGYLVQRGETGTFHATGPDLLDRATLAATVCRQFGLDGGAVLARRTEELGQAARRPLRVLLDCAKLRGVGAPTFRGFVEGLQAMAADPMGRGMRGSPLVR